MKEKKKDLHIHVYENEHRQLKSEAALRGMTVRELILVGLEKLKNEHSSAAEEIDGQKQKEIIKPKN